MEVFVAVLDAHRDGAQPASKLDIRYACIGSHAGHSGATRRSGGASTQCISGTA